VDKNKYKTSLDQNKRMLEQAAEAWVRICIFHIKKNKELANQYKDKNYEYQTI